MKINDAGGIASSADAPLGTTAPKPTSPAAQKFAEYLAHRMKPMIEHATRTAAPTNAKNNLRASVR